MRFRAKLRNRLINFLASSGFGSFFGIMLRSSLRTITLRSPRACSSRSSSTSSPSSSNEPPRPSYFTVETLYPFLLLSIITSLAVNLAYNRSVHAQESGALRAQISVLNKLNERLSVAAVASSSSSSSAQGASVKGKGRELLDEETIERELAMVGLGKAKLNEKGGIKEKVTSWREVFLGKRGKGFDDIAEEQIDWDEGESCFRFCIIYTRC